MEEKADSHEHKLDLHKKSLLLQDCGGGWNQNAWWHCVMPSYICYIWMHVIRVSLAEVNWSGHCVKCAYLTNIWKESCSPRKKKKEQNNSTPQKSIYKFDLQKPQTKLLTWGDLVKTPVSSIFFTMIKKTASSFSILVWHEANLLSTLTASEAKPCPPWRRQLLRILCIFLHIRTHFSQVCLPWQQEMQKQKLCHTSLLHVSAIFNVTWLFCMANLHNKTNSSAQVMVQKFIRKKQKKNKQITENRNRFCMTFSLVFLFFTDACKNELSS